MQDGDDGDSVRAVKEKRLIGDRIRGERNVDVMRETERDTVRSSDFVI